MLTGELPDQTDYSPEPAGDAGGLPISAGAGEGQMAAPLNGVQSETSADKTDLLYWLVVSMRIRRYLAENEAPRQYSAIDESGDEDNAQGEAQSLTLDEWAAQMHVLFAEIRALIPQDVQAESDRRRAEDLPHFDK